MSDTLFKDFKPESPRPWTHRLLRVGVPYGSGIASGSGRVREEQAPVEGHNKKQRVQTGVQTGVSCMTPSMTKRKQYMKTA